MKGIKVTISTTITEDWWDKELQSAPQLDKWTIEDVKELLIGLSWKTYDLFDTTDMEIEHIDV